MMALTKHPVGVIVFSWTAGVMYSTLFTMPYLLIAHYHASSTVSDRCARVSCINCSELIDQQMFLSVRGNSRWRSDTKRRSSRIGYRCCYRIVNGLFSSVLALVLFGYNSQPVRYNNCSCICREYFGRVWCSSCNTNNVFGSLSYFMKSFIFGENFSHYCVFNEMPLLLVYFFERLLQCLNFEVTSDDV